MQDTTIEKIFRLTAAFEGGAGYATLSGDFDGQGISFGAMQWNLGMGTLQRLLLAIHKAGPATFERCLTQPVAAAPYNGKPVNLAPDLLRVCRELGAPNRRAEAVAWARERQDGRGRLLPHWTAAFKALAAEPGFQAIQRQYAGPYLTRAAGYLPRFGLKSQRAAALMFDITIQCGSILPGTARRLDGELARVTGEQARMERIAVAVADQVNRRWRLDVLSRKMTIARGAGVVHGRAYHLARDFAITLEDA